jgi:hypothetical protein
MRSWTPFQIHEMVDELTAGMAVLLFVGVVTVLFRETASMILSEIDSRYGGIPSTSVLSFRLFELRTVSYVFVCYQDPFAWYC